MSDYKEFNGVKFPVKVAKIGEDQTIKDKLVSISFNEEFDAKEFK